MKTCYALQTMKISVYCSPLRSVNHGQSSECLKEGVKYCFVQIQSELILNGLGTSFNLDEDGDGTTF